MVSLLRDPVGLHGLIDLALNRLEDMTVRTSSYVQCALERSTNGFI